jgi:hypothetical protein
MRARCLAGLLCLFGVVFPAAGAEAAGSMPPALDQLIKQSARVYGTRKTVLVASGNIAYLDMLLNWACQMKQLDLKFMVFAMDQQLQDELTSRKIPSYYDAGWDVTLDYAEYGTQHFKMITCLRWKYILKVLNSGHDVLFSDLDIAFMSDPMPHFSDASCDITFQLNVGPANAEKSFSFDPEYFLKIGPDTPADRGEACLGLIMLRSRESTIDFLSDLLVSCTKPAADPDDQFNFAKLVYIWKHSGRVKVATARANSENSQCLEDHGDDAASKLTLCSLDPLLFPTGGFAFGAGPPKLRGQFIAAQLAHSPPKQTVALHANWLKGGKQTKMEVLRATGKWLLDDKLDCHVDTAASRGV